jgi:hypothetical protein
MSYLPLMVMNHFKEFQFGKMVFMIAVPAQIFLFLAYNFQIGNHPIPLRSFLLGNIVIALVYLLFYGMTTTISDGRIQITYGIGLIRKSVRLRDVETVSVVSTPWYYGWGIRIIPNGMLYNINGSGGVELILKGKKRILRIGSANAAVLQNAIMDSVRS